MQIKFVQILSTKLCISYIKEMLETNFLQGFR